MSQKVCSVEGCGAIVKSQGYCAKHIHQVKKYGRIVRTRFDPNEIREYQDCLGIVLYNREQEEVGETFIDKEDRDIVCRFKWHKDSNGYAVNSKSKAIHNILFPYFNVDHIDMDKLNNRKQNLRKCSFSQNQVNITPKKNNKSGKTGVRLEKSSNRWIAHIKVNYKYIFLGRFDDYIDAVKARCKAERYYFDDFAPKHEGQPCRI